MCGRKLFSKWKRLYKQFRVLSCNCLGDRCIWCYFWRMQVACRRAQTNWIVYFYHVIALSSYQWSFEVLASLYAFFRASAASEVYFQFWQKIKVYRSLCFVSKVFFLTWLTTGRANYQNKKGQCRVKKRKSMLVLEIW